MDEDKKPMFVVDPEPVVDWPVVVNMPAAGGKIAAYQFTASIRVLSPGEYEDLFKETGRAKNEDDLKLSLDEIVQRSGVTGDPVKLSRADIELVFAGMPGATMSMSKMVAENVPIFQKLVLGWSDVKDREGRDVPFSSEVLKAQVLGPHGPALSTGLWRAISEIRFGTRLPDGTGKDSASLGN